MLINDCFTNVTLCLYLYSGYVEINVPMNHKIESFDYKILLAISFQHQTDFQSFSLKKTSRSK
jgi:hypothetical protein